MIPHLKYNDENCRLVVMAWRMFSMRQEQGKMKARVVGRTRKGEWYLSFLEERQNTAPAVVI
jgi:hypothetical protein